MNPRILKKLSKRADPYVGKLTSLQRVVVGKDDLETLDTSQTVEKKYRERWGGKLNEYGYFKQKKGTIGYGEVSGYYEREWSDDDAYSILKNMVADHYTDWGDFDHQTGDFPRPSIDVSSPKVVFQHAPELLKTKCKAVSN